MNKALCKLDNSLVAYALSYLASFEIASQFEYFTLIKFLMLFKMLRTIRHLAYLTKRYVTIARRAHSFLARVAFQRMHFAYYAFTFKT